MSKRRSMRLVSAAALVVTLLVLMAAPAFAHEERSVGGFDMAVGFGSEPAYAGEVNSVQLLLSKNGQPVLDLGDTLDVEVAFGDQTQTFPLEPFFEEGEFGTLGDYRAWFIPTSSGQYSFHFTGTIDGQDVDETFTSGPKTFSDVESPQSVEFPVQDPTAGELADRIDRVEPRLASAIGDVQSDVQATADDASSAKTIGLIGIAIGAIGLILAVVALVTARRRKA
jgi:hypothetical protein